MILECIRLLDADQKANIYRQLVYSEQKRRAVPTEEIAAEGGVAKAYQCNVLDKEACYAVADQVLSDFGPCDILLNGAGGNNARATTDKEYFEPGDIEADTKSFFDLDKSGVEFVFNLNFIGTLIPTQAFARQMVGRPGCSILNIWAGRAAAS